MSAMTAQTCLWFDTQAEDAANLYVSLFDDAEITMRFPLRGDPEGRAFLMQWHLMGQRFTGINGGPHYKLSPAASIEIHVDTQDEIDRLWEALLANGGLALQCGWLTDRFGVSWQIVPRNLLDYFTSDDDALAGRVSQAMMKMVKFDVAELDRAAKG